MFMGGRPGIISGGLGAISSISFFRASLKQRVAFQQRGLVRS